MTPSKEQAFLIRGIELASGKFGRGVWPSLGCRGKCHDLADAGCDWALGQLLLTPEAGYITDYELMGEVKR